jgi:tRNA modification GTPase
MTAVGAAPDTIAAIATAPGRGGIGVIRVSGPAVPAITQAVLGVTPAARTATVARFRDAAGDALDHGLALYFLAPHSFTGEHVLELHGHGGPVVLDLVLQRLLELGARPARPGEFSERAFLNGKLDLAQAEAIADLIDSASAQAARAALHSLQGVFSRRVHAIVEQLIYLRTHIEATLDFPEEEIDFLADARLVAGLEALTAALVALQQDAHQGQLLHDGMTVVIAGPPNAGKSSLLNQLSQRDSAIVSPVAGTTRDLLREQIQIDGLPLHIVDTAGLRTTSDEIEEEGVRRARAAAAQADRILLVVDDNAETDTSLCAQLSEWPVNAPLTLVRNKTDLSGRSPGIATSVLQAGLAEVRLSAKSGDGLRELREHLKACMGYQTAGEGGFSARRRHLDALRRASEQVATAKQELVRKQGELAAEQLRLAQQSLSEITGEFSSDDLLGRIFASFCIGK